MVYLCSSTSFQSKQCKLNLISLNHIWLENTNKINQHFRESLFSFFPSCLPTRPSPTPPHTHTLLSLSLSPSFLPLPPSSLQVRQIIIEYLELTSLTIDSNVSSGAMVPYWTQGKWPINPPSCVVPLFEEKAQHR